MFESDEPKAESPTPKAPTSSIEVEVHPNESGDGLRLRTSGLAQVKHPELELIEIPEEQADAAAALLRTVAGYVQQQRLVAAGELLTLAGPRAAMVVGLEAAPAPKGEKKGFFKQLFAGPPSVLRLIEPDASMTYPKTLLATLRLWRAATWMEEEPDRAKEELLASIEYFPGDPARRTETPQLGAAFNWENHLGYALLAQLDPERALHWLEQAFARADSMEFDRLGDSVDDLAAEKRKHLLETVSVIIEHNLDSYREEEEAPGVVMVSSPIWLHAYDRHGESVAQRTVTVLPELFADYYYRGKVAKRLQKDKGLHEIVVDAVQKHGATPWKLALMVQEIRKLYEEGENDQMIDASVPDYMPGTQILSLLLADLGRRLAAGTSDDELRAAYGLTDDEAAAETAHKKLAKLEEREAKAYLAMMAEDDEDEGEEPA